MRCRSGAALRARYPDPYSEDMADDEDAISRLVAALAAGSGDIPRRALGRALRVGGAALRTGRGVLLSRLRDDDIDQETLEKLALSLGELKGIAMKMGQILSYLDTPLPEEAIPTTGSFQPPARWCAASSAPC